MRTAKAKKKNSGLTLVELVIAVGILVSAMGALFGLFDYAHRQSVMAHRRTQAGIEAQIQMESLMSRKWEDLYRNVFYDLNDPNALLAGADGNDYKTYEHWVPHSVVWPGTPSSAVADFLNDSAAILSGAREKPQSKHWSSCGTFIVAIDYEIRRTEYRSVEVAPEPDLWNWTPVKIDLTFDPMSAIGTIPLLVENSKAGDLWTQGELLEADVDTLINDDFPAGRERPLSIMVSVNIYDVHYRNTLRERPVFMFEHRNIIVVDPDIFLTPY